MNYRGCFITFEGGDGSGKTTLIEKLFEVLLSRRLEIVKVREPGGTPLGEDIRHLLLHDRESPMSFYTELCLFLASRAQHIQEVILPALNSKKILLCDRFNDSTIAYQGHARGLGSESVEKFCNFVCENLYPDLTLYLDIDPELGLKRVKKLPHRNSMKGLDRIEAEHISFHQKIREGFHLIAKKYPDRFFIIDASQSIEKVFERSLEIIERKLKYLSLI